MSQNLIKLTAQEMVANALSGAKVPAIRASLGVFAAMEAAFVRWQAKRLAEIPRERLHAQMMRDNRSFAEIRRARASESVNSQA